MNTATLYESDFYGWTQRQAALIRAGKIAELDMGNLLEEIESMGRSEQRELDNRLSVLLAHLLKWQFQTGKRACSRELTIKEQQKMVERVIRENPSLKSKIPDVMENAYASALFMAECETGLLRHDFPQVCPWSLEDALGFTAVHEPADGAQAR